MIWAGKSPLSKKRTYEEDVAIPASHKTKRVKDNLILSLEFILSPFGKCFAVYRYLVDRHLLPVITHTITALPLFPDCNLS